MEKTNVKHSSMQSIPLDGVKMCKKWDESYELFVAYKKEFPDTPVPYNAEYHGFNLGTWVSNQRIAKDRETLSLERIKRLEEARIIWDPFEEAWQQGYKAFVAYNKEFLDTPVPARAEYHGYNLGTWVRSQRVAKNNETLSPEKIKRLEEAGFVWDARQEAWEQGYRAFLSYKKEFPDVPVPIKAKFHDFNLGIWVNTQRQLKKNGTLSAERIKRLEESGFVWAILRSATEVIAMFERGENVSTSKKGLPNSIRKYLCEKYNNSCAIGKVDLNNFSILPKSKQKLDGKICQFTTDPLFTRKSTRMNGAPNLQIAHLDDNFSNNTITNLLPLCPICHGEITYIPEQTREHLRKANVPKSRYSLIYDQSIDWDMYD